MKLFVVGGEEMGLGRGVIRGCLHKQFSLSHSPQRTHTEKSLPKRTGEGGATTTTAACARNGPHQTDPAPSTEPQPGGP